jgi:hypothetical protein
MKKAYFNLKNGEVETSPGVEAGWTEFGAYMSWSEGKKMSQIGDYEIDTTDGDSVIRALQDATEKIAELRMTTVEQEKAGARAWRENYRELCQLVRELLKTEVPLSDGKDHPISSLLEGRTIRDRLEVAAYGRVLSEEERPGL